jgi:hypothetical protein
MSVVRSRVFAAGLVAVALSGGYLAQGTFAAGIPANKVAASGSTVEEVGANTERVILSETVKINNPTDLILSATAECALTTEVSNGADGNSETAFGQIEMWVTIDHVVVPISTPDTRGGRVVFCNRAQSQQWTNSANSTDGDQNDKITQHLDTRTANGFNWMALNVGETYPGTEDNVHLVELHARWTTSNPTASSMATATVGNRTLILEPVKAWNREAVEIA